MTPERWRRIEDLCHAVLALRADDRVAFLETACAGDEELRREVESLIAQEPRSPGFMSAPVMALAGSSGRMRLQSSSVIGTRFLISSKTRWGTTRTV